MAAVSLFWDTNMAAVTSCENTLYVARFTIVHSKTQIKFPLLLLQAFLHSSLPSLESRPLQVCILYFFFVRATDPPSQEKGRWETKHFIWMAFVRIRDVSFDGANVLFLVFCSNKKCSTFLSNFFFDFLSYFFVRFCLVRFLCYPASRGFFCVAFNVYLVYANDFLNAKSHARRNLVSCSVGNLIQPIRSATQIWVVTRHHYGISALVSETSFDGKISGSVAKYRLFFQARVTSARGVAFCPILLSDFFSQDLCPIFCLIFLSDSLSHVLSNFFLRFFFPLFCMFFLSNFLTDFLSFFVQFLVKIFV